MEILVHFYFTFILIVLDIGYTFSSGSQNDSTTDTSIYGDEKFNFFTTAGGAALSLVCLILLVAVLCHLVNVKKRLRRLETQLAKDKNERQQQSILSPQPSIISNVPEDVEDIPRVSRRSEYIRVIRNFKDLRDRVSRSFPFFNTPRSSADTFDLSKQDDPIYDDITQYRPKGQIPENQTHWCCCCRLSSNNYAQTSTSDANSPETKHDAHLDKNEIIDNPSAKERVNTEAEIHHDNSDTLTRKKDNSDTLTRKKKKQKEQESDNHIEVKHVDFDIREICIQPTTTDDVTIGVAQKPVKQVNKEQQLVSFGKKSTIPFMGQQKPKLVPRKVDPVSVQGECNTFSSHGTKTVQGIKLSFPFPIKQSKSLPALNEEPIDEFSETSTEDEKERDPSYIDMGDTLITNQ
ncbi:uncharacterized protein LOC127730116 [Mytilus californianus]|uniref:uncharacterized protein LOC127730116 n=1 Tax=Mytilus californianus TaxID=6549 RepID=UPI0022453594|nr:uncharacterized protein LOC127730116 [Mytilus californianus]